MTDEQSSQPILTSLRIILISVLIIIKNKVITGVAVGILVLQYRLREGPIDNHRDEIAAFEKRLRENWGWGYPIDLFEISVLTHTWIGRNISEDIRQEELILEEGNYRYEALLRLHARACQISKEVGELMKAGYAVGALARWRSLHEISVTAKFLIENDDKVAERFFVYNDIVSYHTAKTHKKYQEDLNFHIVSEEELKELENRKDEIRDEYGNPMDDSAWGWGWAAEEFPDKTASFKRLEEETGLDIYRPYFKLASNALHGSSKGILHSIDSPNSANEGIFSTISAGPTNSGFTDPAQMTLLSLQSTTESLVELRPNKKRRMLLKVLNISILHIAKAFSRRDEHIEKTS